MVFVNDLPSVVRKCTVNLYADDTTIYASNEDPSLVEKHLEGHKGGGIGVAGAAMAAPLFSSNMGHAL